MSTHVSFYSFVRAYVYIVYMNIHISTALPLASLTALRYHCTCLRYLTSNPAAYTLVVLLNYLGSTVEKYLWSTVVHSRSTAEVPFSTVTVPYRYRTFTVPYRYFCPLFLTHTVNILWSHSTVTLRLVPYYHRTVLRRRSGNFFWPILYVRVHVRCKVYI